MKTDPCSVRYFAASLLLLQMSQLVYADFLDKAQEAASGGENYMEVALTPLYRWTMVGFSGSPGTNRSVVRRNRLVQR